MNWTTNVSKANRSWPEQRCLKTFVVDDMPEIVATLTRFLQLQPGFEVVGSAGCAVEALARCFIFKPNLVIIDEGLPDLSGSHCAKLILKQHPQALVVLMSGHDDLECQMRLGCSASLGFVAKARLHRDLITEIIRISNQPALKPSHIHDNRHFLFTADR